MSPWAFVVAAYAVAVIAVAALVLWARGSMRRAEASADEISRR